MKAHLFQVVIVKFSCITNTRRWNRAMNKTFCSPRATQELYFFETHTMQRRWRKRNGYYKGNGTQKRNFFSNNGNKCYKGGQTWPENCHQDLGGKPKTRGTCCQFRLHHCLNSYPLLAAESWLQEAELSQTRIVNLSPVTLWNHPFHPPRCHWPNNCLRLALESWEAKTFSGADVRPSSSRSMTLSALPLSSLAMQDQQPSPPRSPQSRRKILADSVRKLSDNSLKVSLPDINISTVKTTRKNMRETKLKWMGRKYKSEENEDMCAIDADWEDIRKCRYLRTYAAEK